MVWRLVSRLWPGVRLADLSKPLYRQHHRI